MKKKIRILLAFCDRLLIAAMKKVNEISDFNDIKKENLGDGGWSWVMYTDLKSVLTHNLS